MKKAVAILSVVLGLLIGVEMSAAEEKLDCSSLEGNERMTCDLKALKQIPPKIMEDACELWIHLTYEIDPALAALERGRLSEEEAGVSMPEMQRLRHEAGDQFGAYAIGILQMPRDSRRYKICGSGKAAFSWADTYEVAEQIVRSKARVSKDVFKSVLLADISRHLDELRAGMEEGYLPADEAMSCVVSIMDGAKAYDISLSTDQWRPEARAVVDKIRANPDRMCYIEVSIHLRPR